MNRFFLDTVKPLYKRNTADFNIFKKRKNKNVKICVPGNKITTK